MREDGYKSLMRMERFITKQVQNTDGKYRFLRKKSAVEKFFHAIGIGFVKAMCGLLCGIYYGAGRERVERETAKLYEDITGEKLEHLPSASDTIETYNSNKAT